MNKNNFPNAPLYRDPIFDGCTDPVVIYNNEEESWWLLYTQRRSTEVIIDVSNIHGTDIGIASSVDNGRTWLYRGVLPNIEFERGKNTFWAPEIICVNGTYHMYVSYVRGVPTTWDYERHIVHYSGDNLWDMKFESILELSSNRVIDACIHEVEPGVYKMWYKDEVNGSITYSALSSDLYNWKVIGPEVSDMPHEGPNVFEFSGHKWMITDPWFGLGVYKSEDFTNWKYQGAILDTPGERTGDGNMAHHADVVVRGEKAYIFYFVHPYFSKEESNMPDSERTYKQAQTGIQVAELEYNGEKLICDRNKEFELKLV